MIKALLVTQAHPDIWGLKDFVENLVRVVSKEEQVGWRHCSCEDVIANKFASLNKKGVSILRRAVSGEAKSSSGNVKILLGIGRLAKFPGDTK